MNPLLLALVIKGSPYPVKNPSYDPIGTSRGAVVMWTVQTPAGDRLVSMSVKHGCSR